MSAEPPRVWVLTSKKPGDNAQVLSVADALGWPYEIKRLEFTGLNHFHFRLFGPSLRKVDMDKSSSLAPPWPDLVLTIGRRATPVALWIQRQAGSNVKLVQVGQSRIGFDRFALVLANPQHHLPERANVIRLSLPLLYENTEAIAAAAATWRPRFAALPHPWTALLVGGPTAPFIFDADVARDMMRAVAHVVARDGGSLLVSTSRRTPHETIALIQSLLPAHHFFHRWAPENRENPYLGMLGLADRFIVTGESISMLTEAARQRKPLAIYPLPTRLRSARLLYHRVLQELCFPRRAAVHSSRGLRERLGDALVRCGLLEYRRDFSLVHQQLIDRGSAVWLGALFPSTASAPPDELRLVADRITALFPQASPA